MLKEDSYQTGLTGFTGLMDGVILSILLILSESILSGVSVKNETADERRSIALSEEIIGAAHLSLFKH